MQISLISKSLLRLKKNSLQSMVLSMYLCISLAIETQRIVEKIEVVTLLGVMLNMASDREFKAGINNPIINLTH